jgi:hypothetical protein
MLTTLGKIMGTLISWMLVTVGVGGILLLVVALAGTVL